jgi:SAM-dependent methyltransferase
MPAQPSPRYDGVADWYADHNSTPADANRDPLLGLLTPATPGRCLDLGCGTGQNLATLRSAGHTVTGLDYSPDQLRVAHENTAPGESLIRGDAARLPFADGSFDTVAALWISTDVDNYAAVLREAARVLRPGGVLIHYGAHPCFCGPHTENRAEDGARIVHPTYRTPGWHPPAPWWRPGGIRSRVGMRHVPLAELLTGFITAGLTLTRVVEPRAEEQPVPWLLGIRAEKR